MLSIKQEVIKLLSVFVVLLILLFASLMFINVNYGISTDTRNTMIYQGALLERTLDESGVLPSAVDSGMLSIYNDFNSMPNYLRQSFAWTEMKNRQMIEKYVYDDGENKRYIYAMKYSIKRLDKPVYLILNYYDDLENQIKYDYKIQRGNLVLIAIGLILIITTIVLFTSILYWRLLHPVERMFNWITHPGKSPQPASKELKYTELNSIVDSVELNRQREQDIIKREAFFLRTLSHELRTPIAIILSSAELLERVITRSGSEYKSISESDLAQSHSSQNTKLIKGAERATGRILYAVTNMKKLVQTLLWLSRKNEAPLPISRVNLATVISKVIEDNRYLLQDKNVDIDDENIDRQAEVSANDTVIHLLLENLIRNAIQYSHQGTIRITASTNLFMISNPVDSPDDGSVCSANNDNTHDSDISQDHESHGIGLYLVEKICLKKQYRYEMDTNSSQVTARLYFSP
ncbi:hypothetical protein AB733_04220 [Photobacterium swingsii]|uniref:histidine kinase n=1 Tax=Photobacterium swingsii TaxID=680026 RepID=A0A0J8Y300_9GAMM|nr:sensor histidine kinase [Photobacterium swingsii]KMV31944.1 hypothetical protein AB733_04220 [Photobacterium swingsii]PSW25598.1 GHKL domain-containing protein [Photobacterium swingsii]